MFGNKGDILGKTRVITGKDALELLENKSLVLDAGKAEDADEPMIVIDGVADSEIPMTVVESARAGRKILYETATGEKCICLAHLVEPLLRVTLPDGTPRFSVKKPENPPYPIIQGQVKCYLHTEHPR